jgi:integrase
MRIGEVLALGNGDVDLREGIITVRESKTLPMRLVPITECTAHKLHQYQEARDQCFGRAGESGAFFLSSWNRSLSYPSLNAAFGNILERAGLKNKETPPRHLRLHDFRHTFACNHLLRAYRENLDIDNAVHELSVYLGHANIQSTYWYLTGIPALFEQCVMRFESKFGSSRNGVRQ